MLVRSYLSKKLLVLTNVSQELVRFERVYKQFAVPFGALLASLEAVCSGRLATRLRVRKELLIVVELEGVTLFGHFLEWLVESVYVKPVHTTGQKMLRHLALQLRLLRMEPFDTLMLAVLTRRRCRHSATVLMDFH